MYPIGNESDYAMFITVKGESSKSVIGFTVKEEVIQLYEKRIQGNKRLVWTKSLVQIKVQFILRLNLD